MAAVPLLPAAPSAAGSAAAFAGAVSPPLPPSSADSSASASPTDWVRTAGSELFCYPLMGGAAAHSISQPNNNTISRIRSCLQFCNAASDCCELSILSDSQWRSRYSVTWCSRSCKSTVNGFRMLLPLVFHSVMKPLRYQEMYSVPHSLEEPIRWDQRAKAFLEPFAILGELRLELNHCA